MRENAGTELTFLIETQLTDAHPGCIRVRELRGGSRRFLKPGYTFLYQLDRQKETVGEAIARLIYEDQTEERKGRHRGSRWSWERATELHLVQLIERPAPPPARSARPVRREVGTVSVPGGLNAPAIIALIAQVIDEGLRLPPGEAYLSPEPEQPDRKALAPASTSPWQRLPLVAHLTYNNRSLTGSLIFIATEGDGVSIDLCAILPGEHPSCPSSGWYHLFAFEDTGEALFLCDQGVHALQESIVLRADEGDLPHYWLHEQVDILVDGGKRVALSRIPNALANSRACFAEALPSYSIYCSACRLEHRPALDAPVLQEAARRGYVTTLCPHTFWCPICEIWSTPTERTHRLATGEACAHPRPTGWESRLTVNNQQVHALPLQPAHERARSSERPPLHPWYDEDREVQYWLAGMLFPPRYPSQFLTASPDLVRSERQPGEQG